MAGEQDYQWADVMILADETAEVFHYQSESEWRELRGVPYKAARRIVASMKRGVWTWTDESGSPADQLLMAALGLPQPTRVF